MREINFARIDFPALKNESDFHKGNFGGIKILKVARIKNA